MASLRNKRKLAAVTIETQEEHPRNCQSRNTSVPRINDEYIAQVSQEIEGRVTKVLAREFSRTESRFLCALSKLDEFLLNPQIRTHSGTVPGTKTGKTRNQMKVVPRVILILKWIPPSISPVIQMTHTQTSLLTWWQEIKNRFAIVITCSQEFKKIPYCSPGTSSGKQKKACSTSRPQFRSENTLATSKADQILLALKQLVTNSKSAIFNENIKRTSKSPKSLTTTMPTFAGKSEKTELFEVFFQTSLK